MLIQSTSAITCIEIIDVSSVNQNNDKLSPEEHLEKQTLYFEREEITTQYAKLLFDFINADFEAIEENAKVLRPKYTVRKYNFRKPYKAINLKKTGLYSLIKDREYKVSKWLKLYEVSKETSYAFEKTILEKELIKIAKYTKPKLEGMLENLGREKNFSFTVTWQNESNNSSKKVWLNSPCYWIKSKDAKKTCLFTITINPRKEKSND